MHSDRVLHRRLQEFVFVIGTQRERTIHFAREFTTIDELTSHLFLPALRTKTFHLRNAKCITAKSTCRGPVMEWSGRAPAPPAIESGEGSQRQAVNHHCLGCCDAYPTSELGR